MPEENQDLTAYVYGESWCGGVTQTIDEEIKVSFVDAFFTLKRKQLEIGFDWTNTVEFTADVKAEIAELKQREAELYARIDALSQAKTYGVPYQAVYDEIYKVIQPQRQRLEDINTPGKVESDELNEKMYELGKDNKLDWQVYSPLREANLEDITNWFEKREFAACAEESAVGIALRRRRAGKLYHEVAHWEHEFDDDEEDKNNKLMELGRQVLAQQKASSEIQIVEPKQRVIKIE